MRRAQVEHWVRLRFARASHRCKAVAFPFWGTGRVLGTVRVAKRLSRWQPRVSQSLLQSIAMLLDVEAGTCPAQRGALVAQHRRILSTAGLMLWTACLADASHGTGLPSRPQLRDM